MVKPDKVSQALWDTLSTSQQVWLSEHERLHTIQLEIYSKKLDNRRRSWAKATDEIINRQLK